MPNDSITSLATFATERDLTILVIGAHALAELGVPRQTFDLDLMIADSDRDSLSDILASQGYTTIAETENFQRHSHPEPSHIDVDVLFVDSSTFEKLTTDSTHLSGNPNLRVPSIPHFIALKLHAILNNPKREARDLGDITELLRANPGSVSPAQLEEICRTHGPEGVYFRLKDAT